MSPLKKMQQVDQQLSEARQAVKLCTISEVLTTISVNYTSPEISLYNETLSVISIVTEPSYGSFLFNLYPVGTFDLIGI
jgi:hypothetical protein